MIITAGPQYHMAQPSEEDIGGDIDFSPDSPLEAAEALVREFGLRDAAAAGCANFALIGDLFEDEPRCSRCQNLRPVAFFTRATLGRTRPGCVQGATSIRVFGECQTFARRAPPPDKVPAEE